MSKMTPALATRSAQTVEGGQRPEGLERGCAILGLGPVGGVAGGHDAPDDELAVAGARQLVGEPGPLPRTHVAQRGGRLLALPALEPGPAPPPAKDPGELGRAPLP